MFFTSFYIFTLAKLSQNKTGYPFFGPPCRCTKLQIWFISHRQIAFSCFWSVHSVHSGC